VGLLELGAKPVAGFLADPDVVPMIVEEAQMADLMEAANAKLES
jgi:hypothetical protein